MSEIRTCPFMSDGTARIPCEGSRCMAWVPDHKTSSQEGLPFGHCALVPVRQLDIDPVELERQKEAKRERERLAA